MYGALVAQANSVNNLTSPHTTYSQLQHLGCSWFCRASDPSSLPASDWPQPPFTSSTEPADRLSARAHTEPVLVRQCFLPHHQALRHTSQRATPCFDTHAVDICCLYCTRLTARFMPGPKSLLSITVLSARPLRTRCDERHPFCRARGYGVRPWHRRSTATAAHIAFDR